MLVCARPVAVRSKKIKTTAAPAKLELVVTLLLRFKEDKKPTSPLNNCLGSHKANNNNAPK